MRVCIGGTFDRLHKGHKILIKTAFEKAGKNGFVFIGITKGDINSNKKNIQSFEKRKKTIENLLVKKDFISRAEIREIIDKYGPSIDGKFDAIVVSPETEETAIEINKKRKQKGKKPLEIVKIEYVLSEDKKPISSTRIRNQEIDEQGNFLQ